MDSKLKFEVFEIKEKQRKGFKLTKLEKEKLRVWELYYDDPRLKYVRL
jgi:hypothetical protein